MELPKEMMSGMGRYGTALLILMVGIFNATDTLEPLHRIGVFVVLVLLVMLAKYLAVTKGVKDDDIKKA